MKLQYQFESQESEATLCERISNHLTQSGFRLVNSQPIMIYQRGSIFGSMLSFSPRDWKAKAVAQISSKDEQTKQVCIELDINTTGQMVTEKENAFWQNELDCFAQMAATGSISARSAESKEAAESTANQNWAAIGLILLIGVVMAIVGVFVFGTKEAGYITGFIGASLGYYLAQQWLGFKIVR